MGKLKLESVIHAIGQTKSMAASAKLCNVNYKTFRKFAKENGLFVPNQKGLGITKPLKDYTVTKRPYHVKNKLWNLGLKSKICEKCEIGEQWQNSKLVLELHHIDGNNKNNELINLQILCPNCHSQTDNYRKKRSAR